MGIRSAVVAGFTSVALVATAAPALAMGSGNPYEDMQVGVRYTVYEPTYVAGLKQIQVGGAIADAGFTGDENLSAEYGRSNGRNFNIREGNPMSSDIGVGALVLTTTVQGRKARVYGYCDPSTGKKCTLGDVSRYGGHLAVTLPGVGALTDTVVWVETIGPKPVSGQQLVQIAKGLRPVQ
jgi:hypothetical protein